MALLKEPQFAVCPKCKRKYSLSQEVCPADGTPLTAQPVVASANTAADVLAPLATSRTDELDRPAFDPTLAPNEATGPLLRRTTGDLVPGEMVNEYQVTAKIGEGGMGKVYAGVQPLIGKKVAIKLLQPSVATNPEVVNRFIQEARAVNQIRSRYIVDIFSFGELERGLRYFVMEHIDGTPLRQFLQRRGRLFFEEAYAILRAVSKGLTAAHDVGIVHRDLKPENIIVLDEDEGLTAKILDFGIAKLTGSSASTPGFATETGMTLGTPYYMSPEQARGVGVDSRTDIYALGVIMFEMFTGVLPFEAKSYIDLVNKHLFTPPPDASKLADDVPDPLSALIKRCMAKDPAERPQKVDDILSELKQLAPALAGICFATSATLAQIDSQQLGGAHPAQATGPQHQQQPAARRSGVFYVVVGVLLAVLLGGGLYAGLSSPGHGDVQRLDEMVVVKVNSVPSGATVKVDGFAKPDRTPMDLQLHRGTYRFTASLAGYEDQVIDKSLDRDDTVRFSLKRVVVNKVQPDAAVKRRPPGQLVVESHTNARYRIDGKLIGKGQRLNHQLPPGNYSLEISAAGRQTKTWPISISSGKPTSLKKRLMKKKRPHGASKKPRSKKKPIDSDATLDPFKKKTK